MIALVNKLRDVIIYKRRKDEQYKVYPTAFVIEK
jgi:hypothetical protein